MTSLFPVITNLKSLTEDDSWLSLQVFLQLARNALMTLSPVFYVSAGYGNFGQQEGNEEIY